MRIVLRADSGFARETLMAWCEQSRVDCLFGLARNTRAVAMIEEELATARAAAEKTGRPARRFQDLQWSTLDTWSGRRRVVAKAERTTGEANPRFVVTSGARQLYDDIYSARGEMENRIKECQLDLYSNHTSPATMRANQLRLWFASMASVLICALRRIGLAETTFAHATCGTIGLKVLKIGALVRISVRRIKIAIVSACPAAEEWGARLAAWPKPPRLASRRPDIGRCDAQNRRHQQQVPTETLKTKSPAAPSASRLLVAFARSSYSPSQSNWSREKYGLAGT